MSRSAERTLRVSLAPLGMIVLCFFLPFARSCKGEPQSPVMQAHLDPMTLFIWAPFLAAALVTAAIVLGLRRGPDGWPARLAAAAAGLGLLGNAAYLVGDGAREGAGWPGRFLLAEVAAVIVLTGHCLRLAWRRRGWKRLAPLVLGYALQAVHLGVWVWLAAMGNLLAGAYLYLAALAVLLALGLHATRGGGRARRRP